MQNMDDAGTNEVCLCLMRIQWEFDITGGGLEGTQALLAYHDAKMSPQDWTGVQHPGVSHKQEDPHTLGHFSLGFTSATTSLVSGTGSLRWD
ncbi:hypothetical protein Nmel_014839 [Mimus melanotis]